MFKIIIQNGTSNGSPMYSYNNDEFLKANGKTLDDCDFECKHLLVIFVIDGAREQNINFKFSK